MEDEVTRVEAVSYLEGASGHAVFSTLFLVAAGLLLYLGIWGGGVVAVVIAFGVALNGFSIYVWDRLRDLLRPVVESDGDRRDRTLTPYRPSPEMRVELLSGLLMVGGFAVVLGLGILSIDLFGPRTVVYLGVSALGVGNVGALGWKYYTSSCR
ncbi:hypothetical protein ACFQE8_18190 [Salinirubellus sp. GCM10025818]|uniref:hypothetical protein n=1 Tax=Salinirubellus TaxID=2162630 RepID=UPI0030CD365A